MSELEEQRPDEEKKNPHKTFSSRDIVLVIFGAIPGFMITLVGLWSALAFGFHLQYFYIAIPAFIVGLALILLGLRTMGLKWTCYMLGISLVLVLICVMTMQSANNFRKSNMNACAGNRCLIDACKEQWAMETGQKNGTAPDTNAINRYMKGATTPFCPSGGKYQYNAVGLRPECSILEHNTVY